MRDTTTIIISHDPDLVRCAHRVLVIDGGGIVEEGTPADLQRAGGTYALLMQRWSEEVDAPALPDEAPVESPRVETILSRLRAEGRRLVHDRPHTHHLEEEPAEEPADGDSGTGNGARRDPAPAAEVREG